MGGVGESGAGSRSAASVLPSSPWFAGVGAGQRPEVGRWPPSASWLCGVWPADLGDEVPWLCRRRTPSSLPSCQEGVLLPAVFLCRITVKR